MHKCIQLAHQLNLFLLALVLVELSSPSEVDLATFPCGYVQKLTVNVDCEQDFTSKFILLDGLGIYFDQREGLLERQTKTVLVSITSLMLSCDTCCTMNTEEMELVLGRVKGETWI